MLYVPNHGYGLHRLVYRSRSLMRTDEAGQAEFAGLVARSADANRALSLTGALLVWDDWFIQALEGPSDMLKKVFEKIAADPRHTAVEICEIEPIERRLFGRWGMKQGRPISPDGFDIHSATPEDLVSLLQLSLLAPARKAA